MTEIKHQPSNARHIDHLDTLGVALAKAQAVIAMTFGEAGETFRNLNDNYQDALMWTISGLIDDSIAALDKLESK